MNKIQRVELNVYGEQLGLDEKARRDCEVVVDALVKRAVLFWVSVILIIELFILIIWLNIYYL